MTLAEDLSGIATDVETNDLEVRCGLPGPEVNRAQSLAAAHGFTLHGREDGRYLFRAYRTPSDARNTMKHNDTKDEQHRGAP